MTPDFTSLQEYYDYWDNFVSLWRLGRYPCAPYLPEPWWGWTPGPEALHSVVLNMNPGAGGRLQSRGCVSCVMGCGGRNATYSSAMADGTLRIHLADTDRWHLNRRHRPLMKALGVDEKNIAHDTRHHLSVELMPFHDAADNSRYCQENREAVIRHALEFAARASTFITPPDGVHSPEISLRNKVIVRCSPETLLNSPGIQGAPILQDRTPLAVGNGKIKVETFRAANPEFKDVLFVCLWGAHNNLPAPESLTDILKSI